jgi:HPt (histidine-containing phosphotransfer) domain-containing protein
MQAFHENNFDQIAKISHQLKSSCGYLGLQALETDFCHLEVEAKHNNADEIAPFKTRINSHLQQYTDFLSDYLNHCDERSAR